MRIICIITFLLLMNNIQSQTLYKLKKELNINNKRWNELTDDQKGLWSEKVSEVLNKRFIEYSKAKLIKTTKYNKRRAEKYNKMINSQIEHITQCSKYAIYQQNEFGIPAAITLGQSGLEGRFGQSYLAKTYNNHFGIKCHTDKDDDYKKGRLVHSCFRAYTSNFGSYADRRYFLKANKRYNKCFLYGDKGRSWQEWAYQLQKAGYATEKSYARDLIDFIKTWNLTVYQEDFNNSKI